MIKKKNCSKVANYFNLLELYDKYKLITPQVTILGYSQPHKNKYTHIYLVDRSDCWRPFIVEEILFRQLSRQNSNRNPVH